jgi:hypothetical protein
MVGMWGVWWCGGWDDGVDRYAEEEMQQQEEEEEEEEEEEDEKWRLPLLPPFCLSSVLPTTITDTPITPRD